MDSEKAAIRAATPTMSDGLAFAGYVDIASEGGFRKAFGRGFEEIIASAFIQPGHDLSYEYAAFAERKDGIVGMVSGFTAEQHAGSSSLPIREAPGNRFRRAIGLAFLGVFQRIIGGHSDGEFYLQFLAVDEECRGMGIGTSLLGFMEERARADGCARFTIDVSAKNHGAARLYERCGMTEVPAASKHSFRRLVVRRLAKDLEGKI